MANTVNDVATFTAGTALAAYRLVKLTAARTVGYATAADNPIGATLADAASGDADVPVELWAPSKTIKVEASGAISVNALCYAAASGQVASSGTVVVGRALGAASGAGSVIEILPV